MNKTITLIALFSIMFAIVVFAERMYSDHTSDHKVLPTGKVSAGRYDGWNKLHTWFKERSGPHDPWPPTWTALTTDESVQGKTMSAGDSWDYVVHKTECTESGYDYAKQEGNIYVEE